MESDNFLLAKLVAKLETVVGHQELILEKHDERLEAQETRLRTLERYLSLGLGALGALKWIAESFHK